MYGPESTADKHILFQSTKKIFFLLIFQISASTNCSNDNVRHKLYTKKPYLGWRSEENLNDGIRNLSNTPNQRLANSLRTSKLSGSLGSGLAVSPWRKETYKEDWYIKDSIKSVSSAIAEFCKAGDVSVSCLEEVPKVKHKNRSRCRDKWKEKPRVVWLESSFVSGNCNEN